MSLSPQEKTSTTSPVSPASRPNTGSEVVKASAAPTTTPRAESILKSLLDNIKNGKSPTREQLGLYSALQSLQEGADKEPALALIKKQLGEAEAKEIQKNEKVEAILKETREALDSVKQNTEAKIAGNLGPVVSQIFGYTGDFKETTDYDEFLDMLRATVKLAKSGKTVSDAQKLTTSDWKAAGHDGQYIFDKAELEEANAFFAHILSSPNLLARAEQHLSAKTGRDLMLSFLKYDDAKHATRRNIRGVTYEDTESTKTDAKRRIVETAGKTDLVDVLFSAQNALWSTPQVRSILQDSSNKNLPISKDRIQGAYLAVTGESLDIDDLAKHPEKALNFQRILTEKMNFLTEIAKLNHQMKAPQSKQVGVTGLTAILSGKFEEIATRQILELQKNIEKLPQGAAEVPTQSLADMAGRVGLPIAVALLTGGVGIASYENRAVSNQATLEEIARRYDADKPLGALIHNIFLGKEFSLRFGENHAVKAYWESVRSQMNTFKAMAELGFTDGDIAKLSPSDKPMYQAVQKQYQLLTANNISPEAAKGILTSVFFKSIETDAAQRANSEDWSFRLSPLFIGFGREGVSVSSTYSENMGLAAAAGVEVRKLSPDEMKDLGTYVYDQNSKNYILTLKKPLVRGALPEGVTSEFKEGKVKITSENPFRLTRVIHRGSDNTITDRGYNIEITDKKVVETTTSAVPAPPEMPIAVKEARENMLLDEKLQDALFFLGRVKDPQVRKFIDHLARQDYDGARAYLQSIAISLPNAKGEKETYTTLKKNLLNNWDKVDSFLTYMYGSRKSKAKQEFSQSYVDTSVRTEQTIKAEARLAQKQGITLGAEESAFKVGAGETHELTTTATRFPGQEMTVSCFATPLNGLHRIDTYDASVSVSSKIVVVENPTLKEQLYESTLKSTIDKRGILAQVAKLNAYLGDKGPVTTEHYKAYLTSDDITKLGVTGLVEVKKPIFFEARAMIQGNVCMNRIHGIVYPVLGFPGKPAQTVVAPVELDGVVVEGDSGNVATTMIQDASLGINPVAAVVRANAQKSETPTVNQNSTSTTGSNAVTGNSTTNATNAGSVSNPTVTVPGTQGSSGAGNLVNAPVRPGVSPTPTPPLAPPPGP